MRKWPLISARCCAAIVSLLLLHSRAHAAPGDTYCDARVDWFYVAGDGLVAVRLSDMRQALNTESNYTAVTGVVYPVLCSLNGSWNDISAAACQGMLSVVTAATLSKTRVRIKYASLNNTCSSIADSFHNAPRPTYVKLHTFN